MRRFSREGAQRGLDHACRTLLGIDLTRPGELDVVSDCLEGALCELERG